MTNVDGAVTQAEVALVVRRVRTDLGPQDTWRDPVQLPGLGLCILNSILSTGNRSESVGRVLDRYRQRRCARGQDPATDGADDLLAEIDDCGGAEGFADALGTHWRAWSRKTAPLKTEVIRQAADLLVRQSVNSSSDLKIRLRDGDGGALEREWLGLPGQRSGLTWRYFLMNSGESGIKADRMITRWMSKTLGRTTTGKEAEHLLLLAARELEVDSRRLDHAIWTSERDESRR